MLAPLEAESVKQISQRNDSEGAPRFIGCAARGEKANPRKREDAENLAARELRRPRLITKNQKSLYSSTAVRKKVATLS